MRDAVSDHTYQHQVAHRRTAVTLVGAVIVSAAMTMGSVAPTYAAPVSAIQSVGVRIAPDGSITGLSSTVVGQSEAGAISSSVTDLNPLVDASLLPVRVQTTWWANGRSGTNLADIKGITGIVAIEVTVANLTAKLEEVSVTHNGAKYREMALVGVPMTVTAATNLGAIDLTQVIVAGSAQTPDQTTTNGVVSRTASGDTVVQWASLLTPPLSSAVANFRLVMDAKDFVPPSLDITAQPGLTTDSSVGGLLTSLSQTATTMQAANAETIQLVSDITTQIDNSQEFIDMVYSSLSKDATTLGRQTYAELEASSSMILSQISAIQARLELVGSEAKSQMSAAQSELSSGLMSMLSRINNDVLGSPTQTSQIVFTPVRGCTVSLPELAPDAPHTLASAVRLVQAQVDTLIAMFGVTPGVDPDTPSVEQANRTASTEASDQLASDETMKSVATLEDGTCRDLLIETIRANLGDPDTNCSVYPSSARCAIRDAQANLVSSSGRLRELRSELDTQLADLSTADLASSVADLRTDFDTLTDFATQAKADLTNGTDSLSNPILDGFALAATQAQSHTAMIREILEGVRGNDSTSGLSAISVALQGLDTNTHNQQDHISSMVATLNDDVASSLAAITQAQSNLSDNLSSLLDALSGASATNPLPAGWETTLVDSFTATVADQSECTDQWNPSDIDPTNTAQVVTALTTLSQAQTCPVSSLAGIVASLVSSHVTNSAINTAAKRIDPALVMDDLSTIADQTASVADNVSGTNGILAQLAQSNDTLSQTQSALESIHGWVGAIETNLAFLDQELDGLWVPAHSDSKPLGVLADLEASIQQLSDLVHSGDLAAAVNLVAGIQAQLTSTYTGLGVPADCPSAESPVSALPEQSADAITLLSSELICQQRALRLDLTTWFNDASQAYTQADSSLNTAIAWNDAALVDSENQINQLSDSLADELNKKTSETIGADLDMIGDSQANNIVQMKQIEASFRSSGDRIITDLISQINASNQDATAATTALTQDFATILANLGSPDETSRTGILGKLRSTASLVGNTADTLTTMGDSTAGYATQITTRNIALELHTAAFSHSQDRSLPAFPGVDNGTDTFTMFTFHLAGE